MRKLFLPILAIVLLVSTGTWGAHVLFGFGARERDVAVGDEDLVGLVRDLPGSEGDEERGSDAAGRGGETGTVGADPPADGRRGTTTRAGVTGLPAPPAAVDEGPGLAAREEEARPAERTGVGRDQRLISSGAGSVAEEVWIPPGNGWIGTPERWAAQVAADVGSPWGEVVLHEIPRHAVGLPDGLWIERYEVTEERYRTFLEQTSMTEFTTPLGEATNLLETISELFTEPTPKMSERADVAARQLYRANRATLDLALRGASGASALGDIADDADDELLWEGIRTARLPGGLRLRFYDRAPPYYWPSDRYAAGRAFHPVRDLSFEAANDLAMWAGKHLPSEITWEIAARGPQGWDYPWGNNPAHFATRVNGGVPRDRDEPAETVPVTALPEGASWIGCRHLLGNVAEWTRTWPFPYPGSDRRSFGVGTARGGSAANVGRIWVRPALRGYSLDYELTEGAPHPSRAWTGARLARYREPARSRVYGVQVAVQPRWLRIDPRILEPRVYAGAEAKLERRILEPRQDASVRMGVKAFVVQPLASVPREVDGPGGDIRVFVAGVPEDVVDLDALLALSTTQPVFLGLFHNACRLTDTYEARDWNRPRSGRLLLDAAYAEPGSWWICLWHGYLMLWAPQLDLGEGWRIVSRRPVTTATVSVSARRTRGERPPRTKAELQLGEGGQVTCEVESPLGNPTRPDLVVRVRFQVQAEADVVSRIPDWHPGKVRAD